NLRHTVQLHTATQATLHDGHTLYIECSPHPVLVPALHETINDTTTNATAIGTLRRDDGGLDRFLTSLAQAYVAGAPVDWASTVRASGTGSGRARRLTLPRYPFQ